MMKTALITGASSGIGLALADCFAKHGYNLVVVGRDANTLKKISEEHPQVNVIPIVKDLSEPDAATSIFEDLSRMGVTIDALVNNAGFGIWGKFAETDLQQEEKMIQVHITTLVSLIKLAIPEMKKKKNGYILNVGSVHSFSPVPLQSMYAATKSFLLSFSQSLDVELKEYGISTTIVCPGNTLTQFRSRAGFEEKKSWITMDASEVAEIAYQGMVDRKFLVIPGRLNRMYIFVIKHFPTRWIALLTQWFVYSLRKLKVKE